MFKIIDRYIIKKYFATFAYVSLLFLLIAVVIDFTEKQRSILSKHAPLADILLYFATFIPHIFTLLAPLFLLIAVVFFTSRMAANSEIISIYSNGISFYRFLRPYFISSLMVASALLLLNNWLVPRLNTYRLDFLNTYVNYVASNEHGISITVDRNHDQEVIASLVNFSYRSNEGYYFSLEEIKNNRLVRHTRSPRVKWLPDSGKWQLKSYEEWNLADDNVHLVEGRRKIEMLGFSPKDFNHQIEAKEAMTHSQLKKFIAREKMRGSKKVAFYEVELYGRTSNAFAIIILTLIGASFSSHKSKGGTGVNIFVALAISSLYIIFMRFASTFATNADLHPLLAVWIPNILFGVLTIWQVRKSNR